MNYFVFCFFSQLSFLVDLNFFSKITIFLVKFRFFKKNNNFNIIKNEK